jgi:hypothetical protein
LVISITEDLKTLIYKRSENVEARKSVFLYAFAFCRDSWILDPSSYNLGL